MTLTPHAFELELQRYTHAWIDVEISPNSNIILGTTLASVYDETGNDCCQSTHRLSLASAEAHDLAKALGAAADFVVSMRGEQTERST